MTGASAVAIPSPFTPPPAAEGDHLFIHPGQLLVCPTPTRVTTIVGSCVSICLWDRRLRIGGLNHFMLPRAPHTSATLPRPYTYADLAVPALLERLADLGSRLHSLEAKLFGGAHLLGSGPDGGPGMRNIAAARELLEAERIPVVAEDVSGPRGRKLIFDSGQGSVLVFLL
jgi:chemotaxis protein CheD